MTDSRTVSVVSERLRDYISASQEWFCLWWSIPAYFLYVPLFITGLLVGLLTEADSIVLKFLGLYSFLVIWLLASFLFFFSLVAGVAVYIERKRLPEDGDWYPSEWYYILWIPTSLIGYPLAYIYTARRLDNYGAHSDPSEFVSVRQKATEFKKHAAVLAALFALVAAIVSYNMAS